jgi:hypothetical protein
MLPRWLWISLLLSILALCWLGTRHAAPPALAASTGEAMAPACVLPPRFTDENEPLQSDTDPRMPPFRFRGAGIVPLAGFSLQARVLSREDYALGTEADYSPVDLALGWGPMADPAIDERLTISQSGRWYHYRWDAGGPPLPLPDIVTHSANMHLVPADANVADALDEVRRGDVVRLHGWLIRIERDGGWRWQSSLTRGDSGGGACELVYVCAVERRVPN